MELATKSSSDFADAATIAQGIKTAIFNGRHYFNGLPDMQRESLELIATNIARIIVAPGDSALQWRAIGELADMGLSVAPGPQPYQEPSSAV